MWYYDLQEIISGGESMRNLTIKRDKNFVGSLTKVKVYIEDAAASDLTICGTHCRFLGKLKNGEEKTFEIGDSAAKVYVIIDKLSKDYCFDCYSLPEGQEPVSLSGCCMTSNGSNAFRFYGNDNPEAEEARKKGSKKSLIISLIAAAVALAIGIGANAILSKQSEKLSTEPKTYQFGSMTVKMVKGFNPVDVDGSVGGYFFNNLLVCAVQEKFADYEYYFPDFADWTLEEYAEMSAAANDNAELKMNGDIPYFELTNMNELKKQNEYSLVSVYKSDDSFWLLQFTVPESEKNEYQPHFFDWAKSVKFN